MTKKVDMEHDPKKMGERLHQLCKDLDISAKKLADSIGVSRQTVSQWQKGEMTPNSVMLMRLCSTLRTSPEYIMIGEHRSSQTDIDLELLERAARISIEKCRKLNFGVEPELMAKIITTVYERALDGGDEEQLHNTGADIINFTKLK